MSYNGDPILFEPITAVTATASTELGIRRKVGDKKYVYIYNGGSADATPGIGMTVLTAAVGVNTLSASATAGHVIKCFTIATIPAASYGWGLVEGPVTISCNSNSSSLDLGSQQAGAGGICKTLTTNGYPVGNLNTAVVSGNTGLLWVQLP